MLVLVRMRRVSAVGMGLLAAMVVAVVLVRHREVLRSRRHSRQSYKTFKDANILQ